MFSIGKHKHISPSLMLKAVNEKNENLQEIYTSEDLSNLSIYKCSDSKQVIELPMKKVSYRAISVKIQHQNNLLPPNGRLYMFVSIIILICIAVTARKNTKMKI